MTVHRAMPGAVHPTQEFFREILDEESYVAKRRQQIREQNGLSKKDPRVPGIELTLDRALCSHSVTDVILRFS